MGNQEVLKFRGAREPRPTEAVGGAGPTLDHPEGGVKDEYAAGVKRRIRSVTVSLRSACVPACICVRTRSNTLVGLRLRIVSSVLCPC
jgi:hypothetical protein